MEDSEKLMALKKAYADIILNTAKEAAARIMVSEKKAHRFQRELVSTKEEALRLLVRLKQMLDAKACEAESTSCEQQKKIEELEAQLEEAEEIVRDLREELRVSQAQLERVTSSQMHPQDEKLVGNETLNQEEIPQNQLTTHEPTFSVPESQFVLANHCEKYPTANGAPQGSRCYVAHNYKSSCFVGNPDFASIVIRRKEPELYRNGCTQRIRAFERSLLESNLSLSAQADDIKNEIFIREEENKQISVAPRPQNVVVQEIGKKPEEQELMETDNICISQSSSKKAFRRKRKRATRYKRNKPLSFKLRHDKVNDLQNVPQLLCARNSSDVADEGGKAEVNSCVRSQDENQLHLISSPNAPCDTCEMGKQFRSMECAEGDFETSCVWNESNDDKELMNGSGSMCQDNLSADTLHISACRAANKASENQTQKESHLEDKIPSQSENNMVLKYTFQRKRKKEYLSSSEGDCSLGKRNLTKQAEGVQNGLLESPKSCSNTESSRGNRRLAQVARQLISLSEKKWWQ